jgi:hypothetical protein
MRQFGASRNATWMFVVHEPDGPEEPDGPIILTESRALNPQVHYLRNSVPD